MAKKFLILVFTLMFFSAGFTNMAIAQETETVYIGVGDHYALGPYYAWGEGELWVNMTVEGGNVDVYVMDMNQYMNAYPYEGEIGGIAFKSSSQENVSQATIFHQIETNDDEEYWGENEIWVIIDNRDVSATPDDASPSGNVRIELEITWTTDEFGFDDEFLWFGILAILGSLVPIILIVVLLFLIWRRMDKKKETQPAMPNYYQYPPAAPPQEPGPPTPPVEETPQEPASPENQEKAQGFFTITGYTPTII